MARSHLTRVVTLLLVLPSCADELDAFPACDAVAKALDECGMSVEALGPNYTDIVFSECTDDCESACLAEASCLELVADETGCGSCVGECRDACDDWTPLVLAFTDSPVRFVPGEASFDFGHGPVHTDWPSDATPWLALDRNGNAQVDDATELFGDASPLRAGGVGPNGFVALADLDDDRDGLLTLADPAFSRLLAWADADGDRRSSPAELRSLASAGITALDLDHTRQRVCDPRENCEGETSSFRYVAGGLEGQGRVIDVYLRERPPARDDAVCWLDDGG